MEQFTSWMLSAQAQVGNLVGQVATHKNSMNAESPFTNYTAGVVIEVILVCFFVSILLIGGMTVVNLAMMSKREEDRDGVRAPSDVAILGDTLWPGSEQATAILPAEDEGQGGPDVAAHFASRQPSGHEAPVNVEAERKKREEWRKRMEAAERERREAAWEQGEDERRGRTERPPRGSGRAA